MTDRGRLLIVDDECEILDLMKGLLQGDGFTVFTAESGLRALELLNDYSVDVMITDIRMPGMDGIELIVKAMKQQPYLQCIVATGHGDIDTAIKAMKLGAINYFQKPININEVIIAVENGLERIELKKQVQYKNEQILQINSELKDANDKLERRVAKRTETLNNLNSKLIKKNKAHLKTEVQLRKREKELARLAMAVENAAEDVIVTDSYGIVEYVNPAFEHITGYSSTEVIGQNPNILKSGMHDQEFYQDLWSTIISGKIWRGIIVNRKKDGTLIEEDSTISPIIDNADKIIGFVAVKRDISEQIKLEEMLRQSQKMEAIGTLAGGIAHDFNNILSVISGYAGLAREDMGDPEMLANDIEEISIAADRATGLVRQILTFSRKSEKIKQILQVSLIVKEGLKMLRSSLPATIEIKPDIASAAYVLADPVQIQQIVMNLGTNAYHAMRESGGILNVSLKDYEISDAEMILEQKLSPGRYQLLSISDTGTGMNNETKAKIFDPYFTTKNLGEGTGLGLAVVHGIVESHGGAIVVESELGQGAVFHIYLPVNDEEDLHSQSMQMEPEPLIGGNESIMIVDDEKANLKLLSKFFQRQGYNVSVYSEGDKAFRAFQNNPCDYDLVITDMTMPNMTGTELSGKLLEISPSIPIILCSGFSEQVNREKTLEMGIREYFEKPLNLDMLIRAVRKMLDDR